MPGPIAKTITSTGPRPGASNGMIGYLDRFRKAGILPAVSATTEFESKLRAADLRVTRPRVAVLGAVHENPHADTNSIIAAVRADLGEVSHQAVYDGLSTLAEAGLLRRIQPPGSVARYESQTGDNHHHMVCRCCGAIADVECAVGDAPCLEPARTRGFRIDESDVVHRGLCPDCLKRNTSDQPSSSPPRKDPRV